MQLDQPFDERQADPEPVARLCPGPPARAYMSKIFGSMSAEMPMPSSRTTSTALPRELVSRTSMVPPIGVYFAAFVSRLTMIWFKRTASPCT